MRILQHIALGALLVIATSAPAVEIEIGSAIGSPGDEVTVDVFLHDGGSPVAGTQNDIVFPPSARIAALASGRPSCAVNPAIDKAATMFGFLPFGCLRDECNTIRALVLALDNVDPIPDGARMYSCQVFIAPDAPAASQDLECANADASDPDGNALATSCADGEVLPPGATPAASRTRAPNATPPVTRTATPTRTPTATFDPRTPRPLLAPCDEDLQCGSHICVEGFCCRQRCGESEGCDGRGECAPLCQQHADCRSGLCDTVRGVCSSLRSTGETDVGTGSGASDGCAIASTPAGGAWWLLLPILAAVRRTASAYRERGRARVRVRERAPLR